jgi:L-histidine Nalpha-methyltransferase
MGVAKDFEIDTLKAVEEGFLQNPKQLPSWLFYDEVGDKIFQAIMEMQTYYPTQCELEIITTHKEKLLHYFSERTSFFELIELGAGDGKKTEVLLSHLLKNQSSFLYTPVDVSETVLIQLVARLKQSLPSLAVQPANKKYDEVLNDLDNHQMGRRIILFLGANIGNFTIGEAVEFLTSLATHLNDDDLLMVGFDLKKDPAIIQSAYDDSYGITRDFNMNILSRLNRELGAQFDLAQFKHYNVYDPGTGTNKSYLISLIDQDVYIEALERKEHFQQWEVIHTEVSQKYDRAMIQRLAKKANLDVVKSFYDSRNYFCDVLFRKKPKMEI